MNWPPNTTGFSLTGLSRLVREIHHRMAHGRRIEVESKPDEGSTCRALLPRR